MVEEEGEGKVENMGGFPDEVVQWDDTDRGGQDRSSQVATGRPIETYSNVQTKSHVPAKTQPRRRLTP